MREINMREPRGTEAPARSAESTDRDAAPGSRGRAAREAGERDEDELYGDDSHSRIKFRDALATYLLLLIGEHRLLVLVLLDVASWGCLFAG